MPPTAITTSNRYFDVGVTKCYFLPTIAATDLTPTRVEMDAGTDLSGEIADLDGWTVEGDEIETPDMGSLFTGSIPGRTTAEDCSLTFHASKEGEDARTLLPRGTEGFIMWCDGGDTTGNIGAVFPIRVKSCSVQRNVDDENARIQVQFSVSREPAEAITIPATV
jgi:hypothetical protein